MNPFTRFIRTFASAEIPVVVAVIAAFQAGGEGLDEKLAILGTIAALIAAASAYLLALKGLVANTPLGKAVAQFLQVFGSGLATVVVSDLTGAAAVTAGKSLGWIALAAVGSALLSLLTLAKGDDPVIPVQ